MYCREESVPGEVTPGGPGEITPGKPVIPEGTSADITENYDQILNDLLETPKTKPKTQPWVFGAKLFKSNPPKNTENNTVKLDGIIGELSKKTNVKTNVKTSKNDKNDKSDYSTHRQLSVIEGPEEQNGIFSKIECPVCKLTYSFNNGKDMNDHIDDCLSMKAIYSESDYFYVPQKNRAKNSQTIAKPTISQNPQNPQNVQNPTDLPRKKSISSGSQTISTSFLNRKQGYTSTESNRPSMFHLLLNSNADIGANNEDQANRIRSGVVSEKDRQRVMLASRMQNSAPDQPSTKQPALQQSQPTTQQATQNTISTSSSTINSLRAGILRTISTPLLGGKDQKKATLFLLVILLIVLGDRSFGEIPCETERIFG